MSGESRLCHPQEALGLTILIGMLVMLTMEGCIGRAIAKLVQDEGGSPSMWNLDCYTNTLFVWELKKEGVGKLCVKQKRAYPLGNELFPGNDSQLIIIDG